MWLYHGTSEENLEKIIREGFKKEKIGSCWGLTYGEGVYFSKDKLVANVYGSKINKVLAVNIDIKPYKLIRSYIQNNRKDRQKLKRLRNHLLKKTKYNCFETDNTEEIIIFHPDIYNLSNPNITYKIVNIKN